MSLKQVLPEQVNGNIASDYITPHTELPKFYPFPEYLLWERVSQTAKLVYMLLYDRTRLFRSNNRIKNGYVYVNYTIKSMSEALGKSVSTIKNAYGELDQCGLLIRRSGGFSKPNDLYVLMPSKLQISDMMKKMSSVEPENNTFTGLNSVPATGRKQATNKVIETNNKNQNNRVITRTHYGKYKNIYPSDEEYAQLEVDYPDRIDGLIEEMSSYVEATGKVYKNHEAALRSWAEKEKNNQRRSRNSGDPHKGFQDYSFKPGESF